MTDRFDPDSWPKPPGQSGPNPPPSAPMPPLPPAGWDGPPRPEDDDFEAFAYNDNDGKNGNHRQQQDDFGFFDDDDFSTTGSRAPEPAGGGRHDYRDQPTPSKAHFEDSPSRQYDDYGPYDSYDTEDEDRSKGYDDPYDDGYDDFDFDREPQQSGGGLGRKILGVVAILFVVGAIGLLVSSMLNGDDNNKNNAGSNNQNGSSATGGNGSNTNVVTTTPVPNDVAAALSKALEGWGQFAADGNLDHVNEYFVTGDGGKQYETFSREAESIQASPSNVGPLIMTARDSLGTKVDDKRWVVRAKVAIGRQNAPTADYPWEFVMTRQSSKSPWLVLSVRNF